MQKQPGNKNFEAGLFTDLYELTMLQSYFDRGMNEAAVFDFFVRDLPPNWNYLLVAGLEDVLDFLENIIFTEEDLGYLSSLQLFSKEFLQYLKNFKFTGEVWAIPEGTPVFPMEPLLEIRAPLMEAQIIETYVLNQMNFQTLMASKASRVVLAAQGRLVVDFGTRRMHGVEAGLKGVRCFYMAGVDATSNLLAGKNYGIPVKGTMAHSYIQAHESEVKAFENFLENYPNAILLVDTYDTLQGVQQVVELFKKFPQKFKVNGIRLDSGDLVSLARKSRKLLDEAGLSQVTIFASGGLDEYDIERLIEEGAPIDGFGVGTKMGVSSDRPYLDSAYKLVEYAGRPRLKLSPRKTILPGPKQVFRQKKNGNYTGDEICLKEEVKEGFPLLKKIMKGGKRKARPNNDLRDLRDKVKNFLNGLPKELKILTPTQKPYPVIISPKLSNLQSEMAQAYGNK